MVLPTTVKPRIDDGQKTFPISCFGDRLCAFIITICAPYRSQNASNRPPFGPARDTRLHVTARGAAQSRADRLRRWGGASWPVPLGMDDALVVPPLQRAVRATDQPTELLRRKCPFIRHMIARLSMESQIHCRLNHGAQRHARPGTRVVWCRPREGEQRTRRRRSRASPGPLP